MRGRGVAMNIVVEFFLVTFKVLWAFVLAAARWLVRPKEKSVAGQVCLITGAGSGGPPFRSGVRSTPGTAGSLGHQHAEQ